MKKNDFYQNDHTPEVYRKMSRVLFQFADKLNDPNATYPIATTTLNKVCAVDLPKALHHQEACHAVAILRGLSLDIQCDPSKQPKDKPVTHMECGPPSLKRR